MITIFTILLILITGWSQYRNGLFTSIAMLIMVFLSGLVAFNFWEPIADQLDGILQTTALVGCEDMILLTLLFSVTFFLLRLANNYLNTDMIDEHGTLQHFGAGAVGLVTGYLVAGFLICAVQTLPLDVHFLDFQPRAANEPVYRSVFPPDRVWLSLMRHAGANPLAWQEDEPDEDLRVDRFATFDRHGTFELRYQRYRRTREDRGAMQYSGEFDVELGKKKLH